MKNIKNEKLLKIGIPILFAIIFILIIWLGYILIFNKKKTFLDKIDTSTYGHVTYEAIYGIHLNLEVGFETPENISNHELVLTNGKNEINLNIQKNISNNTIKFKTSEFINKGINLEFLNEGTYYLLIKGFDEIEKKVKYYSVENKTNYQDLEYYTITKNNKNNKINIEWNTYEKCPTLKFTIKETNLPEEIYDITIDPGHGGHDLGAEGKLNNKTYYEANLNLDVSLKLKKELENLGYKVAITRTENVYVPIYEKNGSATMANDTKSKFNLAIHHNSFAYQVDYLKGFEIYIANDTEFDLANILLKNLETEAHTFASPKETYQISKGIYQRFFTEEEIDEDDVKPSNKTTNTIYYYNLREVGGISTHATNDGRYISFGYPKNEHYNSNNTAESLLLELGYVNNPDDLKNLIENKDKYAYAIAKSINDYLKNNL